MVKLDPSRLGLQDILANGSELIPCSSHASQDILRDTPAYRVLWRAGRAIRGGPYSDSLHQLLVNG